MIIVDETGLNITISLKTPEEWRQAIEAEVQNLNQAEIQARAAFTSEMQRIEARREVLEEMWRKTYETD